MKQNVYFGINTKLLYLMNDETDNNNYHYLTTIEGKDVEDFNMKFNLFLDGWILANEMTYDEEFLFDETEDIVWCNSEDLEETLVIDNEIVNYVDVVAETDCINHLLHELNIPNYDK